MRKSLYGRVFGDLRKSAQYGSIAHMTIQSQNQTEAVIPEFHAGDRLRKARELSGLGQGPFAQSIGISRGSVSNYERAHRPPKPIVLKAWSLATGVPVEWLEYGTGPTGPTTQGPEDPSQDDDAEAALARLAAKKRRHAGDGPTHRYLAA